MHGFIEGHGADLGHGRSHAVIALGAPAAADSAVVSAGAVNAAATGPYVTALNGVLTEVFTGSAGQYMIGALGAATEITDNVAGRDGSVLLAAGVQQARFSDYTLVFDPAHTAQDTLVYGLYETALGRVPDNAGFLYWTGIVDAATAAAANAAPTVAAAAAPYLAWATTTSTETEQAAAQAQAAASAFEAVFAATVPPPVIAANRAQLAALIATNLLGVNTPAIVATEAYYEQAWAQDLSDAALTTDELVSLAASPDALAAMAPHISNGYWTSN